MSIQFYSGYPVAQFGSQLNPHMMEFMAQLIEHPGEDFIYIRWHCLQADALEPVQNSIDGVLQTGYLLQNNLEMDTIGIILIHPAFQQTGKTTDRSQGIPDLVGDT